MYAAFCAIVFLVVLPAMFSMWDDPEEDIMMS